MSFYQDGRPTTTSDDRVVHAPRTRFGFLDACAVVFQPWDTKAEYVVKEYVETLQMYLTVTDFRALRDMARVFVYRIPGAEYGTWILVH